MFADLMTNYSTVLLIAIGTLIGIGTTLVLQIIKYRILNSRTHTKTTTQNQHWIHSLNTPMLIFNANKIIITRNKAFESLCPKNINFDLLNEIHHFFPQLKLNYSNQIQGPMTLFNQHTMHWQVHYFKEKKHHILQLIPHKIISQQHLSTEIIQIIQRLLLSISHDTKIALSKIREATQKIENMHDFNTERTQFFAQKLHINQSCFQHYFKKNQFSKTLLELHEATAYIYNQLNKIEISRHQKTKEKIKFSIQDALENALKLMLKTKTATYYTEQGITPIFCCNTIIQTTTQTIECQGDSHVFASHLVSIYEWMTLPQINQLNTLSKSYKSSTAHQKYATMNIIISKKTHAISIIFIGHYIEGHLPLHQIALNNPNDVTQSHITITNGLLALLQLQNQFQIKISTKMNTNTHTTNQYIHTFELELTLPINTTLNTQCSEQKSATKKSIRENNTLLIKEDPITTEFLESLHQDTESTATQKNTKPDMTIH